MAGINQDVIYGSNVDFTGTFPVSGQMNLDGELLVGATTAPFIRSYIPTGSNGLVVNTGPGTLDFSLSNIPNSSLQNSTITITAGSGISITGSPVALGSNITISATGGGTVTNVSGTANQVSVANGTTTPVISLVGPYAPATYTAHGVLIGATTSSIVAIAAGSAGQVLQSGGASADPSYSTSTFPSTATGTGKVLIADGTNWVASTPTFPNASATSGKIIKSDGTNWIASTETYAVPSTSGNVMTSDGTNWTSAAPATGFQSYITSQSGNPADATTYYIATGGTFTGLTATGDATSRIYFSSAVTIKAFYGVITVGGTLGSSQNVTVRLRKNDTSNTDITTTLQLTSTANTFNNTGLSLSMVAGDYLEVLVVCPTWTTNPTSVRFSGTFFAQ